MKSDARTRKTLKVDNCLTMKNAIYMWFMQKRSEHLLISRETLKAKNHQILSKNYQEREMSVLGG